MKIKININFFPWFIKFIFLTKKKSKFHNFINNFNKIL